MPPAPPFPIIFMLRLNAALPLSIFPSPLIFTRPLSGFKICGLGSVLKNV